MEKYNAKIEAPCLYIAPFCQSLSTDTPLLFDGFTFYISLFNISWNLFCCVVWSENLKIFFFQIASQFSNIIVE
jgi:hypothetical protein